MKYFRIASLFILAALAPCAAFADISLSASVDKNVVALDDAVALQVDVSGAATNVGDPQVPDLSGFTLYSSGRSQNISIVNGRMNSSVSFRYTLVPRTTGKFTIPSILLQHDGKVYRTTPIDIEVVAAGRAPSSAPATAEPQEGQSAAPARGGRSLFVTASLDRTTACVNEQVAYTFRFYRRVQLLSNPQYQPANFSGFWTEDTAPRNYYAIVDGQKYLVAEVKTLLFATKPGKYELGPAALQCQVQDFDRASSDDFFNNFFSNGRTQVLKTDPLSVTVLPLPDAGKPAAFGGAVGQFTATASLDRNSTRVNEPVTLSFTVAGNGNIKTVPEPLLPEWADFRKYETASSLTLNKDQGTLQGSKQFKTIIVPLTPGKKTIQPLSFAFFDPAQKKYRTALTAPLVLDVAPGAPGSAAPSAAARPEGGITVVNRDINYLKSLSSWHAYAGPLYRRTWFLLLNLLPLLALACSFGYLRWQDKLSSDIAFARRLKASGTARAYLKKARSLLAAGDDPAYYAAISRALLEFIAHKLNVAPDGLTSAQIDGLLSRRKVPRETVAGIGAVLEECDMVRFAPVSATAEMKQKIYARAGALIALLEKELKRP